MTLLKGNCRSRGLELRTAGAGAGCLLAGLILAPQFLRVRCPGCRFFGTYFPFIVVCFALSLLSISIVTVHQNIFLCVRETNTLSPKVMLKWGWEGEVLAVAPGPVCMWPSVHTTGMCVQSQGVAGSILLPQIRLLNISPQVPKSCLLHQVFNPVA